jgi:hypothetical protein
MRVQDFCKNFALDQMIPLRLDDVLTTNGHPSLAGRGRWCVGTELPYRDVRSTSDPHRDCAVTVFTSALAPKADMCGALGDV